MVLEASRMTTTVGQEQEPSVKGGVYLRGIEKETYSLIEMLKESKKQPRVIDTKKLPWHGSQGSWNKEVNTPDGPYTMSQTLHIHFHAFAPGARSEKHGHQNEAMFIVLDGRGYDVHDGEKIPWEAGDVAIVPDDCVHQHFNPDAEKPARVLIVKPKPLFMMMGLLNQYEIERKSSGPNARLDFNPQDMGW